MLGVDTSNSVLPNVDAACEAGCLDILDIVDGVTLVTVDIGDC